MLHPVRRHPVRRRPGRAVLPLALVVPALALGLADGPAAAQAAPTAFVPADQHQVRTVTFGYTGAERAFTVPAGVTSLHVEAVGAEGGDGTTSEVEPAIGQGGRAARVTADLEVTPGQVLYVRVGGEGGGFSTATYSSGAPGWNGGGTGGQTVYDQGAGGGGATDIRTCAAADTACDSLASRLLVAAGGGGAGMESVGESAGDGIDGGDAGAVGESKEIGGIGYANGGNPGTSDAGGTGGTVDGDYHSVGPGEDGVLGVGGDGGAPAPGSPRHAGWRGAGGGGGGLFGGGGGGDNRFFGAGGGGGSSLVPDDGTSSLAERGTPSSVVITYDLGPVTSVPVEVPDTPLVATGTDTVQVVATPRTAGGVGVAGLDVALTSSDPGVSFGEVADLGDGRYVAEMTGSTTPGTATVTATAAGSDPDAATDDVVGTAEVVTEGIDLTMGFPTDIPASGRAELTLYAQATGRITSRLVYGLEVDFTVEPAGPTIGPVTAHDNGLYSAVLAGTTTAGSYQVTATARPVGATTPLASTGALVTQVPYVAPGISAAVTSSRPPRAGWYSAPVRISFTCTGTRLGTDDGGSQPRSETGACPAAVTLARDGRGQVVERSVSDDQGFGDTVSTRVSIDRTAPTVRVDGARNGATYPAARTLRCRATDALSGVGSCRVTTTRTRTRQGTVVRWTAKALDRAGNARSTSGRYTIEPR
ncbi:hypothetical protein GCM10023340_01080 [Nocardioides marinquilinus]|uniref:receptor protein-tyrosine kinase n=1 Tax=Nocardioides marinquilinus TaxID=1210400 RepID=A0ABP9P4E8_9ACTN